MDNGRSDDIWWEGAEETRGRTQYHHSSRPVDTATLADEYDMNAERNSSPGQTTNNMQRLDKLFQKTVTGVFNSIKTAVGAEGEDDAPRPLHDWNYVCTSPELSVGGAVARLVGARRALSHVEAALDPLEPTAPVLPRPLPPADFEEWCVSIGSAWSASCALCGALGWCRSHVAFRVATLLFADLAESLMTVWLDEFSSWLRVQTFVVFELMSEDTGSNLGPEAVEQLDVEETCDAIMSVMPELFAVGAGGARAGVSLALRSLAHEELNRDLVRRALDLFAARFRSAARRGGPTI